METTKVHHNNYYNHLDALNVGESFYLPKDRYGYFHSILKRFRDSDKKFKSAAAIDNKEMMVAWRVK